MLTSSYLASSDFDIAFDEPPLSEYELERGKPIPSRRHSLVQSNIVFLLKQQYSSRYRALSELTLRLRSEKYVPDISLYYADAFDWNEEEVEVYVPPLLAIEIVSPSQSIDEMKAKADKYLASGVRSVWIVLPSLASVMVLHAGKKAQFFNEGTFVDSELGIELSIDAVFE